MLLLGACKAEPAQTPDWTEATSPPPAEAPATEQQPVEPEKKEAPSPIEGEGVRFMAYNVYNYLTMRRGQTEAPKPEEEKAALVKIIVAERPDVLGVCEIGSRADLMDLQERLKEAGLPLAHAEHICGSDGTRCLGLLSRFPITATNSQDNLSYELQGITWGLRRGLLDATVDTGDRKLRFVGCHLKSKREIKDADQELIRQSEAQLVRDHAEQILAQNPDEMLLVYGDFNDTIKTKSLSILKGHYKARNHLADYYFTDSRGELWTHFWNYQDVYSRFDYILHTRNLRALIDGENSYIVDHEDWRTASDHRALLMTIK
ncbi:MAG: endonuclease/exonuclease/phosphatase family protein [Verrucomicrobiota bacterium JB023]|nr:endonuclease/exonuclease/phosphatase family protein [Verrucomicrobiota bacterium JB023]